MDGLRTASPGRRDAWRRIASALTGTWLATAPAGAETLQDALAAAYRSNPMLLAQRARAGSTEAQVRIERAAGRPAADVEAGLTQNVHGARRLYGYDQANSAILHLSAPIYQGGRVRDAVRGAEARADAGREDLRTVENRVLADVARAYVDVVSARRVVALDQEDIKALEDNLTAVQKSFEAGDLTRTDIDQSNARLGLGRAQALHDAAALSDAEDQFRRLVGTDPGDLSPPDQVAGLPATIQAAEDVALAENPELASAAGTARGAGWDARAARAARLPTVSATMDSGYYRYSGSAGTGILSDYDDFRGDATQAGVTVRLPLYQGGQMSARIDQARLQHDAAERDREAAERRILADVRSAWSEHQAAAASRAATAAALAASADAFKGMGIERGLGLRHVSDVLAADQDRLAAQKAETEAERDETATAVELLAAMGRFDAAHLRLR